MKKIILLLITCAVVFSAVAAGKSAYQADPPGPNKVFLPFLSKPSNAVCQFGIAIGSGSNATTPEIKALMERARISAMIEWGAGRASTFSGVDYINVLFVGDYSAQPGGQTRYQNSLEQIESLLPTNQGQVWLIGNEPDTTYLDQGGTPQDNLLPEEYARRYFAVAKRIRQLDPSAHLGFGNIVQPTPLRLRYLGRVWDELVKQAGTQKAASGLVDIWVSHSFILNEEPTTKPSVVPWGTGIPPGFENDHGDAFVIGGNFSLTYSNEVFERNIRGLRSLMAAKGERNKPLWITEYGSLFPPVDKPGGPDYVNISDEKTAEYMVRTFDFMRTATHPAAGLPTDGNRLVQRWFWYSLSGPRHYFGGTLFDPANNYAPTVVGKAYLNYVAALPAGDSCRP